MTMACPPLDSVLEDHAEFGEQLSRALAGHRSPLIRVHTPSGPSTGRSDHAL